MPLSEAKIEVAWCLDAKHAQDELLALARALGVEDTRLHYEVTGDIEVSRMEKPKIVTEVMQDEPGPGMLWQGRLTTKFSSSAPQGDEEREFRGLIKLQTEMEKFDEVTIPGWGRYNIRYDMNPGDQIEMFEEVASDQGASREVIKAGVRVLIQAFEREED